MKASFICLICLCQAYLLCAETNQLIQSLQNEAQKIAATIPSDYSSLVIEIKANGLDGYDSCAVSGFNQMIAKYDFTQDIIENFQEVTFSESIEFQAFQVNIQNDQADIIEFIGTGMNSNGTIQIAFLYLFAEGTPVPQFNEQKSCHDCDVFFECCEITYTERPFTQSEIQIITDAVRGTAMETFLQSPPSRLTDFPQRATYLYDQNEWDVAMSSWLLTEIAQNSTCYTDIQAGLKTWASQKTEDEQYACMIKTIPQTQDFEACILCMCSQFYFATTPMPISDQTCFNIFFPGVSNLYDFQISGSKKITSIHFWDFQ